MDKMTCKYLALALFSCFALSVMPVFPETPRSYIFQSSSSQLFDLKVHNLNTTRNYAAIQDAIDADETLDGHVITVDAGIYRENVFVNKSLSLVGEDRSTTIIDGSGNTIVYVKSENVEIRGFTIRNGTFGLWFDHAENAKIVNNALSECTYGIRLYHSSNAQVIGNYVSNCKKYGVELDTSGNSLLRNNSMVQNKYNFGVDGHSLSDFLNDIDDSNTVNGKHMRFLRNQHNLVVDSRTFDDFGYLGFVNSSDIRVENLNTQDNVEGLLLAFVANSSIANVNAADNWNGIYVTYSTNVSVSLCNANHNFDYGIKFFNSSHSSAIQNNVDNNGWAGIGLFGSPNSVLDSNEANFNSYNLHIVHTNNSLITRNNASGLVPGKAGGYSIAVYYSHNNLIYRNSFSTTLLFVESRNGSKFTPGNSWDNGFEGNYWLSYGGWDDDYDGIGDAVCNVGEGNVDNYPLMGRFRDYIVSFQSGLHNIATICNSTIQKFDFDPDNRTISLTVSGQNGTLGFCRIAVSNALIQDMGNGNLSFTFNGGLQSTLLRNWTDGETRYWCFSYVHNTWDWFDVLNSWHVVIAFIVSSLLISAGLVLFMVFKRRRAGSK